MNYFYITGASRGIGKALTEQLFSNTNNFVYGISRSNSVKNDRFKHIKLDLSNLKSVSNFEFELPNNADGVYLINNAGTLGHVAPVGENNPEQIINAYNINIISPAILINTFIRQFQNFEGDKVIANTSSGAARHVVSSWSSYCSTKAALDMYADVIEEEQKYYHPDNPVRIFSIAPGIVDTKMQDQIRDVNPDKFKRHSDFVSLKKNNQLTPPKEAAKQMLNIILHPQKYNEVKLDLRAL